MWRLRHGCQEARGVGKLDEVVNVKQGNVVTLCCSHARIARSRQTCIALVDIVNAITELGGHTAAVVSRTIIHGDHFNVWVGLC
jgi:hypothetical protein